MRSKAEMREPIKYKYEVPGRARATLRRALFNVGLMGA